ncbi:lipopolysaccharide core biosynthesis protein [Pseudomonas sp. BLCC-B13]|uniref:lipopolysaccharide core biosynthesis protein n=1 Tax=Pseudomonas sp. BLCC-B13 TaxID=3025314 RepID=UPI00234EEA32|nr:lipopolysaccharide core biosynthesis protein [Pseudomonas sp. BLCC-B13]MDC7827057.1 lipopolysaccharide core biosynthesis protein [Pseudomonas sp. BLCC-B13]
MDDHPMIEQRLADLWDAGRPFEACRGQYSGTLIVLASGPSAADFPIERYRHVPMVAMNGSIVRFAETGIRPLFYLCDDRGFVRLRLPLVRQGIELAQHAALGSGALEVLLESAPEVIDGQSVYLMQRTNRPLDGEELSDRRYAWSVRKDPDLECRFSLWRQKPNRIGFSRNLAKGYFGGRTIPYAALQLGYHLGFSNIVLVGVDMGTGTQPGRFYEQGDAALPSRLDEDYDDYILPSFELVAERVVGPHFRVFGLSQSSRLPERLVPRLSLDQLDALLAAS